MGFWPGRSAEGAKILSGDFSRPWGRRVLGGADSISTHVGGTGPMATCVPHRASVWLAGHGSLRLQSGGKKAGIRDDDPSLDKIFAPRSI